jgi:acetyl-CoA synthetase
MARHDVRNSFLPPTALKLMRQVAAPRRHSFRLRSIGSGGEALGEDILGWCHETFSLHVNEFYGQTEANLTVGNCNAVYPSRPRSIGRAIPGHEVEILSPDGDLLAPGERGVIAVRRNPVHMLGYWNDEAATARKYVGDWLLTGDLATKDTDGYFWYESRDDDIISSGGYRIGPTDIEDCIIRHPDVLMVAVVGSPDPIRGEVVKAFVQLRGGVEPSDALAEEIKALVRERLAAYQYPREIEFVDELPTTATGKLRRNVLREQEKARPGR